MHPTRYETLRMMSNKYAIKILCNVALLVSYACIFAFHWSSVPYLTTPYTWRTNALAELFASKSSDVLASMPVDHIIEMLGCNEKVIYDATTTWESGNISPSCSCIQEKLVHPAIVPETENIPRILLGCVLDHDATEMELATSWKSSLWVINPAVVVGLWNVFAVVTCSVYFIENSYSVCFAWCIASLCMAGIFLYPIGQTAYIFTCIAKITVFVCSIAIVYISVDKKATIRIMDWLFWTLYAFALHYGFAIYNCLRIVR